MVANSQIDRSGEDIVRFGDVFSLVYYFMAREAVDTFGGEGDAALRRALRGYGAERGYRLRLEHEAKGLPINLHSLFTVYDLPVDRRFRRNPRGLDAEQRLSQTLECPYCDEWKRMNGLDVGRTYCEEVHHALYGAYHPSVQTNLARTLTRGDDFCDFVVYLRRANQKAILNPKIPVAHVTVRCEEDLEPVGSLGNITFSMYWFIAHEVHEAFGSRGEQCIREAVRKLGAERGRRLRARHQAEGRTVNLESLMADGDIPRDPRFHDRSCVVTASALSVDTVRCPYQEIWRAHGDLEVGRFYCEEVYQAMWKAYDPGIQGKVEKTLTKGSGVCEFRACMK